LLAARHELLEALERVADATRLLQRMRSRLPQSKLSGADAPTFDILATPNTKQQRAFDLLQKIQL
jgi:hypothetical protein